MAATKQIPGELKVLRAVKDLSYDGRLIPGTKWKKVVHGKDNFEFKPEPGETFTCDQFTARGLVESGKAILVSGGACVCYPSETGIHAYVGWKFKDDSSEFDLVEVTRATILFPEFHVPAGTKVRLKLAEFIGDYTFQDDPPRNVPAHLKVLRDNPRSRQVTMKAVERDAKVETMWKAMFPVATA